MLFYGIKIIYFLKKKKKEKGRTTTESKGAGKVYRSSAKLGAVVLMAVPPSETESTENRTFLSQFYSHYIRNRFHALYPFFPQNFFSNFAIRFRSTPRRECLPLPLPSSSLDSPVYAHFPLHFSKIIHQYSFLFQCHFHFILSSISISSRTETMNIRVFDVCAVFPCRLITKRSRVHGIVEGILERVLINLHSIQKNLQFWQFRAKVLSLNIFSFCFLICVL